MKIEPKRYALSIIVPVYNTEKYLRKCLESLVSQLLEEIEIIVVNDGATDASQDIIDEYCRVYPDKVTAFIKENGGLSDARNFGMEYIRGDYFTFVDSDDCVEPDMYRLMYDKAQAHDFDMVICDVNYIFGDRVMRVSAGVVDDTFGKADVMKIYTAILPTASNKIYKRQLAETGIRFTKGVWFEDVEYIYKLLPQVTSIGVVPEPFYQYLQRQNSITYTFDYRLKDIVYNMDRVVEFYKQNDLFFVYRDVLEYAYVRYVYATFIRRAARLKSFQVFRECLHFAQESVRKQFKRYRKNRYFYRAGPKGWYLLAFSGMMGACIYIAQRMRVRERLS